MPDTLKSKVVLEPEAAARVYTPYEQYLNGVLVSFDGLGAAVIGGRKQAAVDIDHLVALRHLRFIGVEGRDRPAKNPQANGWPVTSEPPPHRIVDRMLKARARYQGKDSLIRRHLKTSIRELVRREGLTERPAGIHHRAVLGIAPGALDGFLDAEGWRPGPGLRTDLLRELLAEGVLESYRKDRWVRYAPQAPLPDPETMRAFHRIRFFSVLSPTVVQRLQKLPGLLHFVGFMGSEADRLELGTRLDLGIRDWLEAHRIPWWHVQPGQEDGLVQISLGITVGARHSERGVPPAPWLEELLQTVCADVMSRMGDDDDARLYFQRALVERALALAQLEQVPDGAQRTVWGAESLGIQLPAFRRWAGHPNFFEQTPRPFERTVVPELTLRVHGLLQERWPQGFRVTDIREHAIERGWPVPYQNADLIQAICERLVTLQLIGHYTEFEYFQGPLRRAFKALGPKGSDKSLVEAAPKKLPERLHDFWQTLCVPEGGTHPHFFTQQAILKRDDVPALCELVTAMRDAERERVEVKYVAVLDVMPEKAVLADSLLSICCHTRQIPLTRPHGRYT